MTTYSNITFNFRTTSINGIDLPMKRYNNIDLNFMSFVVEDIEEHMRYLREDFVVKSDDVYICTYPRSGTNWTHEIVQMLLQGNTNFAPLFAFFENLEQNRLETVESPRVICTHLPYQYLPPKILERAKIICVFRNPKDVAVSVHNVMKNISLLDYNASWDEYLKLFLNGDEFLHQLKDNMNSNEQENIKDSVPIYIVPCGKWFTHVKDWERIIEEHNSSNIMTLKFEEMKFCLMETIEKLANFLCVQKNPKLFAEIANKCDFKCQYVERTTNVNPLIAKCSKNTPNMLYRKGEVGDWKNWFTVAQNEQFDKICYENMKDSKLEFKFTI